MENCTFSAKLTRINETSTTKDNKQSGKQRVRLARCVGPKNKASLKNPKEKGKSEFRIIEMES